MSGMASGRYTKDLYISWDELQRDTRTLCHDLLERRPWTGIVAVARGGLIPAAIISRELDVRLVDTVCAVSYRGTQAQEQGADVEVLKGFDGDGDGWLLIDDLVDTGRTAKTVRAMLPKAFFATVYAKPEGQPYVDAWVRDVPQSTWIRFPWDTELAFAVPLAERE